MVEADGMPMGEEARDVIDFTAIAWEVDEALGQHFGLGERYEPFDTLTQNLLEAVDQAFREGLTDWVETWPDSWPAKPRPMPHKVFVSIREAVLWAAARANAKNMLAAAALGYTAAEADAG
jgi:hypothetical protein